MGAGVDRLGRNSNLDIWCQLLASNLENNTFPTVVSPFKTGAFSVPGNYCVVTPVVSHALLAQLQNVVREKKLQCTYIHHDHPPGVWSVPLGKVAVPITLRQLVRTKPAVSHRPANIGWQMARVCLIARFSMTMCLLMR